MPLRAHPFRQGEELPAPAHRRGGASAPCLPGDDRLARRDRPQPRRLHYVWLPWLGLSGTCDHLEIAFWSGDPDQIRRIFEASGQYRQDMEHVLDYEVERALAYASHGQQASHQRQVLQAIQRRGVPTPVAEIAGAAGCRPNTASVALARLAEDGRVDRVRHGWYAAAGWKELMVGPESVGGAIHSDLMVISYGEMSHVRPPRIRPSTLLGALAASPAPLAASDIAAALGVPSNAALRQALSRLARTGRITRTAYGLYAATEVSKSPPSTLTDPPSTASPAGSPRKTPEPSRARAPSLFGARGRVPPPPNSWLSETPAPADEVLKQIVAAPPPVAESGTVYAKAAPGTRKRHPHHLESGKAAPVLSAVRRMDRIAGIDALTTRRWRSPALASNQLANPSRVTTITSSATNPMQRHNPLNVGMERASLPECYP